MLIGELLLHNAVAVYTTPIPRLSSGVTFYVNVLQRGVSNAGTLPTIGIDIEHRDAIDDTWAVAASFTNITATGVASKAASNVKELVRLKVSFPAGSADAWCRIAFLMPPVWT